MMRWIGVARLEEGEEELPQVGGQGRGGGGGSEEEEDERGAGTGRKEAFCAFSFFLSFFLFPCCFAGKSWICLVIIS